MKTRVLAGDRLGAGPLGRLTGGLVDRGGEIGQLVDLEPDRRDVEAYRGDLGGMFDGAVGHVDQHVHVDL